MLSLLSIASANADTQPTGDHILLITIDDLNDWVGCLSDTDAPIRDGRLTGQGHPQASTPHLDRLARRGVLFTNAHCQAPMCRPSRASFLSGLRPTTTGLYGNRNAYDAKGSLRPNRDVPWITRRFEQAGYETFAAGKVNHGSNKPLVQHPAPPSGQGPYPDTKINVPAEVTPKGVWDWGPYPDMERFTDRINAHWTIERMRRPIQNDAPPRFMALGFYRPHVPLFAPQAYFDAAPAIDAVALSATQPDDLDDLPRIAKRMHSRVMFESTTRWVLAEEKRLRGLTRAYLATTSAMDDQLGEVIDALDSSDMADDTWIVVLSDHGWHLGEKDHVAKQTLWTRSTRVPLIIVPPRRIADTPRGVRCDRPVELLDVYPTLVAAAGVAPVESDRHLDGLSLLPWLAEPAAEKTRPAITTLYAHNHSVVGDRYRYTRYADGSEELYDRQADPHEFTNLADRIDADAKLQAAVQRLAAHLPKDEAGQPDLVDDRVAVQAKDKLSLAEDGRPIMTYNAAAVKTPDPEAPWLTRSGFIHPVYSPSGRVVTDAFPADHPHQHGLMFAWTSAEYEGQRIDFWNSHKKQGEIEHVKTISADNDRIVVKLRHNITAKRDTPLTVLHETWTLTRVPHDTMNVFDLVSVQTNVTDKPLKLRKHKYGAMCVRGPAHWSNGDAMLTSEGLSQATGNHTRPNWIAMFGKALRPGQADGDADVVTAGIAAMSHPDNRHGPQPARLHPEMSYFCFAPTIHAAFEIPSREALTSRFRFVTFDGKPDANQLDAIWQDYTKADPDEE